jgi:UDP-N-acetylmuramyl pentapeptide synthase
MQPIALPGGATVLLDAYKAAADTVHVAADMLRTLPARRRIVVLGGLESPPNPQRPHYREAGLRIGRAADLVIVVGDSFDQYWAGLRLCGHVRGETAFRVATVHEALAMLRAQQLGPDDLVLVKGRGVQRFQRIALALQGVDVRCELLECHISANSFCSRCPHLGERHPGIPAGQQSRV